MLDQIKQYGFGVAVDLSFDKTIERTREELAQEGFGVLAEIDIAGTLKKKLGVDFPPYVILGACNPPLAHQALTAEREIGLLLPCNVIVYADEGEHVTRVAAMDPEAALALTGNEEVAEVASEVKARLARVLEAVGRPG
jgi:uncharacterized protein (DUF302 family)